MKQFYVVNMVALTAALTAVSVLMTVVYSICFYKQSFQIPNFPHRCSQKLVKNLRSSIFVKIFNRI